MASRSLGTLTIDLAAKTGLLEQGLDKSGRAAQKYARDMDRRAKKIQASFDKAFKAVGIAAVAAGAAFVVAARKFDETADSMKQIGDLATGLGVNVGKFSSLVEMMDDLGVNAEGTGVLVATLERNLVTAAQGSATMAAAFKTLGVNIKGTNEPFAVLLEMSKQISEHGLTSNAAAALTRLFGSQAKTLGTLLQQGPEAIKKATQEMLSTGQAFTVQGYQAAVQYYNAVDAIGDQFTALKRQIVVGLAPAVSELANQFSDWVNGFVQGGGVEKIKTAFTEIRGYVDNLRKGFALFSLAVKDASATLAFFQTLGRNSGNIVNNGRMFSPDEFAQNMQAQLAGKKAPNKGSPFSIADWKKQITAQFATLKDVYADNNKAAMASFEAIDKASQASEKNIAILHGGGKPPIDPAVAANAAAAAATLANAYDALAKASAGYANSLTADDPLQKANDAMAAGIENLAKLREAYIKAGGSAKLADELFDKGLTGLKDKFTFDLHEPQRQLEKYTQSLDDQLDALSAANDVRTKSMTLGDHEAANMQALAADTADATKELTNFIAAHQLINGKLSENDQASLDALKDFLDKRHKLIAANQDAEDAIRSNMSAGWQKGIAEFIEQTQDKFQQGAQLAQTFTSGFADAFEKFASGAESAKEAFGSFIDDLFAQALRFVANQALAKIFEAFGNNGQTGAAGGSGGGGWGGLFSSILGAFGGGRAMGGPVAAGGLYRVNENGPEMLAVGGRQFLMMGPQSGTVQPTQRSRGFGGTTINVAVQPTSSRRTADQVATAVARQQRLATARNG